MQVTLASVVVMILFAMAAGSGVAEDTLACTTDRHVYRPGQSVQIECTNHGADFVVTGVTFLVTTVDRDLIYNPAVPEVAVAVPPRESVEHAWDQTFVNSRLGPDGEQVPPGRYLVTVRNGEPARFRIDVGGDHPTFKAL